MMLTTIQTTNFLTSKGCIYDVKNIEIVGCEDYPEELIMSSEECIC